MIYEMKLREYLTRTYSAAPESERFALMCTRMAVHGIRVVVERTEKRGVRRVLFSTKYDQRNNIDMNVQMESSGAVFNVAQGTWDQIMAPPLLITPLSAQNKRIVGTRLRSKMFQVHRVYDGTVLNIYHVNGRWYLATQGGFNVAQVARDGITYENALRDCLSHVTGVQEPVSLEQFYAGLDRRTTYQIGIHHPMWQPLSLACEPQYGMWFIGSSSIDHSKNLVTFNFETSPAEWLAPCPIEETTSLNTLIERANDGTYENAAAMKQGEGQPLYGYVLRSHDVCETGLHSNILISATLLRELRGIYYNVQLTKTIRQVNRPILAAVNALVHGQQDRFMQLFPDMCRHMGAVVSVVDGTTKVICALAKSNNRNRDRRVAQTGDQPLTQYQVIQSNMYCGMRSTANPAAVRTFLCDVRGMRALYFEAKRLFRADIKSDTKVNTTIDTQISTSADGDIQAISTSADTQTDTSADDTQEVTSVDNKTATVSWADIHTGDVVNE